MLDYHGGNGIDTVTGGALADVIYGGGSNDALAGGAGMDLLKGEAGNDLLEGGGASDTLEGGDNTDILLGGAGADTLDGGAGADTLNGGVVNDTLTGGIGTDTFVFASTLGAGNIDTITDYKVADDVIHLDDAIFKALVPGALANGAFALGAAAGDADDRILYDAATGALRYDADGTGAGAAVQFATLETGLAMSAGEFFVI
ncbi:calcium-binding protein [Methylobrevis pamukkalensis]|nr:calcium-binding protein [Methylobrevis pamukkalensis]